MDTTKQYHEQQEAKRLHDRITSFIGDFKVGTLLNSSGIRKMRGVKPLELFTVIFMLPFQGVNFAQGIAGNPALEFEKDAAYDFLRNPKHNWRKFMLGLVVLVVRFLDVLTNDQREKVLIFDDSTYDRSRSKVVELLSWVYDHNSGKSIKGLKLLTFGWSDGASFLPLDFVLCSSTKADKRIQGIKKKLDKRSCGYKRRQEAITKSTAHLETMVKRVLAGGIRADYILMDSWFCFPSLLATLGQHLPVICMAKNMPKIFYRYQGKWLTLGRLFAQLKKRPGRARILASVVTETRRGQQVKIVFVRHHQKRKWLAVLSTKIDLPDEEIVRIYGKRWDIEVFFKMMKHYLNLERETQLRDYDGMVAHITIAMSRYIFLSFEQRCHDDPRTLGTLFYACSSEMRDLNLIEALQRLTSIAMEKVRAAGIVTEDVVLMLVDTIMSVAVDTIQKSRTLSPFNRSILTG
ncbi:transposase [Desulfogranum marinum]|uniref:IS4 family transposase n=1 Tax=Desulfogranum marinum TaxID=453220 RepID=UPI0029C7A75E|nr:transposase [Desulfogranum marinum]